MITAVSAGRASSRRSRHRASFSLSKSVNHKSVDLGEPASDRIDIKAKLHIRISLECSREELNRSQAEPEPEPKLEEFGRDHTLSTQEESSSEDEQEYYTGKSSSSTSRSSARSIGQDPPGRGRSTSATTTSSKPIVTGSSSNIFNHYYIFPTVLGEGRYGSVRECTHLNTKQYYAVKSIKKSKIHISHLQRELYLLSKINHKNIIRLVDVFEDAEFVHIISDKCDGGELFDMIVRRTTDVGCFDEVEAATIIKSLLEAVSYLHWKGIVHRDIKPENILFVNDYDDDLSIKLIDFGLSRRHQKGDAYMHECLGTPYYMAPELVKGKYDQSCDIWSVGIVAYIMLCGYPPFNGETDLDIFEAIKQANFKFPSRSWKHVSPEAKDFIKCLLRKDPRKRFTAEEALKHPWIREGSWIRKLDCWYQQQQLYSAVWACLVYMLEQLHSLQRCITLDGMF